MIYKLFCLNLPPYLFTFVLYTFSLDFPFCVLLCYYLCFVFINFCIHFCTIFSAFSPISIFNLVLVFGIVLHLSAYLVYYANEAPSFKAD